MSVEFLLTSFLVVLAPGTGVLITIASGLTHGRLAAMAAAFGCTIGIMPHLLASIVGLAALLHTSALLFQIVKYAGVAYLLYLAWQTLREKGALSLGKETPKEKSAISIAVTAALVNTLNPKLSIFFLAFLPQFIHAEEGAPTFMMLVLGGIFMAMTFVIFAFYGLFAARLRHHILNRPSAMTWFRRGVAGAFTALGAKLAMAENT